MKPDLNKPEGTYRVKYKCYGDYLFTTVKAKYIGNDGLFQDSPVLARDIAVKKDNSQHVTKVVETTGQSSHVRLVLTNGVELYLPKRNLVLKVKQL